MKSYSIKMWVGVGLIVLGGVALWYAEQIEEPKVPSQEVATSTGEHCAKGTICDPDDQKPVPTATSTTFKVQMEKTYKVNSTLSLTPIAITQDSRCPIDVTCIQAGMITIRVQINNGGKISTADLSLGTQGHPTVRISGNYVITMTEVAPAKTRDSKLTSKDYTITYNVTY